MVDGEGGETLTGPIKSKPPRLFSGSSRRGDIERLGSRSAGAGRRRMLLVPRVMTSERGGILVWLIGLLGLAGALFAAYIWLMLHWSFSAGERAGWVQKLSKKGYLCKTWEGEMAMVSLPGSVPEKFTFTVWDDRTAQEIFRLIGRRVALSYEEHIWLPTTCFGETRHFVKRVQALEDTPAPMVVPSVPGQGTPRPAP
jgi:hypothetical protein